MAKKIFDYYQRYPCLQHMACSRVPHCMGRIAFCHEHVRMFLPGGANIFFENFFHTGDTHMLVSLA